MVLSKTSSFVDLNIAEQMVRLFVAGGGSKIDTARIYANGECEDYVARAILRAGVAANVSIGTKAHPAQPGGLSLLGLQRQWDTSLAALMVPQVDEFYLHQPDTQCSLLESLKFTHQLVLGGKVKIVGLSNYHAHEVQRCFELCEEHSLTKPKVYQVRSIMHKYLNCYIHYRLN